jgi:hypothetical protein
MGVFERLRDVLGDGGDSGIFGDRGPERVETD